MNEELLQKIIRIYSELEVQLLDEMVSHFKVSSEFINSDTWRLEKLQELGILNKHIVEYIANATRKSPREIEKALKQIGMRAFNFSELTKAYRNGYLRIDPEVLLQKPIIENLIQYSYNDLTNRFIEISKKIEQATRNAYLSVVEEAYLQTSNRTYVSASNKG